MKDTKSHEEAVLKQLKINMGDFGKVVSVSTEVDKSGILATY